MSSARPLRAPGHGGVDFEERVDFDRLRRYRLDRSRAVLDSKTDTISRMRPRTWQNMAQHLMGGTNLIAFFLNCAEQLLTWGKTDKLWSLTC